MAQDRVSAIMGFVLAFCAFALFASAPLQAQVLDPLPLVGRIHTDRPVYRLGETIYYRHEFYNPNPFPVTFQPPRIIHLTEGYTGEEMHPMSYTVPHIEQPDGLSVTIPPFGVYYPSEYSGGIGPPSVGIYDISFMGSVTELRIIP